MRPTTHPDGGRSYGRVPGALVAGIRVAHFEQGAAAGQGSAVIYQQPRGVPPHLLKLPGDPRAILVPVAQRK